MLEKHSKPLGAPVYENNARTYSIGSRGGEKQSLTTPVLTH